MPATKDKFAALQITDDGRFSSHLRASPTLPGQSWPLSLGLARIRCGLAAVLEEVDRSCMSGATRYWLRLLLCVESRGALPQYLAHSLPFLISPSLPPPFSFSRSYPSALSPSLPPFFLLPVPPASPMHEYERVAGCGCLFRPGWTFKPISTPGQKCYTGLLLK